MKTTLNLWPGVANFSYKYQKSDESKPTSKKTKKRKLKRANTTAFSRGKMDAQILKKGIEAGKRCICITQ